MKSPGLLNPKAGKERLAELQKAWQQKNSEQNRQLVIRLVASHEHTAKEIAKILGIGCRSVFLYLESFLEGGVAELLKRHHRVVPPA